MAMYEASLKKLSENTHTVAHSIINICLYLALLRFRLNNIVTIHEAEGGERCIRNEQSFDKCEETFSVYV